MECCMEACSGGDAVPNADRANRLSHGFAPFWHKIKACLCISLFIIKRLCLKCLKCLMRNISIHP